MFGIKTFECERERSFFKEKIPAGVTAGVKQSQTGSDGRKTCTGIVANLAESGGDTGALYVLRCNIGPKEITSLRRNGNRTLINVSGTPEIFDRNKIFPVGFPQHFIVSEVGVNTHNSGKTIGKTDDRHTIVEFCPFDLFGVQCD